MRLREQIEHGAIRLQILDCDCGDVGCDHVIILANVMPKPYWLAASIVSADLVAEQVDEILRNQYLLAHGLAVLGVLRGELETKVACIRQNSTWTSMPDWIFRVPIETVWRVRRVVFGDDFTRTIRALKALDAYVPELEEGPVPAPSVEALFERQMRVQYPPEKRSLS